MKLALIGIFHRRLDTMAELATCLKAQTRAADELWLMGDETCYEHLLNYEWGPPSSFVLPFSIKVMPHRLPWSFKVNVALRLTRCDVISYFEDDCFPDPTKYELMMRAIEEDGRKAVYCTERRAGIFSDPLIADRETDGGTGVGMSQVAHLRTEPLILWPEEMGHIHSVEGPFLPAVCAQLHTTLFPIPAAAHVHRVTTYGVAATRKVWD